MQQTLQYQIIPHKLNKKIAQQHHKATTQYSFNPKQSLTGNLNHNLRRNIDFRIVTQPPPPPFAMRRQRRGFAATAEVF